MAMMVPLAQSVRRLTPQNTHPGLMLDKYVESWDPNADSGKLSERVQKPAVEAVVKLSQSPPQGLDYSALLQRWKKMASARGGLSFQAQTISPLTLHLARASALENAGICLHPLYGFAYLPGSGLKGMARAYAETVWLPAQSDQQKAWRQIEDAFGWAPNPDRRRQINDPNHPADVRCEDQNDPHSPEIKASCGNIVFHDAWPEYWPRLVVDIVNNHHPDYYQHDDNEHAPGDWENPVPVYFLAVAPGLTFTFALAKRRSDVPDESLALAKQWLLGALCHLGAGAKTAAGYGAFKPAEGEPPALPPQKHATFETTLELVTPAFLAGANQQAEDCDLRPATLRGLLRWWWRTMHAGYVDVKTLRALEAAIWGDTDSGGAVRIKVCPANDPPVAPIPVPGKQIQKDLRNRDVLRADGDFSQRMGLNPPPNQKTTQGILYLSYGMDEMPADRPDERKQRFIMPGGAKWHVRLTARDGFLRRPESNTATPPMRVPASLILQQARAALWLLCHYGGVGSKARNGFGSLAQIGQSDDESKRAEIEKMAADFRRECPVPEHAKNQSHVPSLKHALEELKISTPWKNYWFVLDQLGYSIQAFAQKHKRNWIKEALGLPRKISTSNDDGSRERGYSREFDRQTNQQVVWLGQKHRYLGKRQPKDMRHAAPVHFHIARQADGTHVIRAIAFPCELLPDWNTSCQVLKDLLKHLNSDLAQRCKDHPQGPPPVPARSVGPPTPPSRPKRPAGTPASVKIVAARPKGGYDVQEEGRPRGTLTVGKPPAVPPQIGETVAVEVHNDDPRCPQYRWPQPFKPPKPGGPGRRPPPRR